jgi:hypothetical protein
MSTLYAFWFEKILTDWTKFKMEALETAAELDKHLVWKEREGTSKIL